MKRKNKSIDESIDKRQNTAETQTGDNLIMWNDPVGTKWVSKKGKFMKSDDVTQAAINNATERKKGDASTTDWVLGHYFEFLDKAAAAASGDESHDFSDWNAKRLVWELGNDKSLAAIRNIVSNYSKTTQKRDAGGFLRGGIEIVTLSSGPRTVNDPKKKLEEYHRLYKKYSIDKYLK